MAGMLAYSSLFPNENKQQLEEMEHKICRLDFDVFELSKLTNGKPLLWTGLVLFKMHNLIEQFEMNEEKLINFLVKIEELYDHENQYHNNTHAADVAHAVNYLITTAKLIIEPSKIEILSVLFSAICHDVNHPGVNNMFLMKTLHPLAITHNDFSVLESHHCSTAFKALLDPNNNFLSSMSRKEFQIFRKNVVYLILGTDFSRHRVILDEFRSYLSKGKQTEEASDRLFLLLITLKCADLGHTIKPLSFHIDWSTRITEETKLQAIEEVKHGICLVDSNVDIEISQINFLSGLVKPLFSLVNDIYLNFELCSTQLNSNLLYWEQMKSEKTKEQ